ncbi:glycosyltransferase family 2 protein [Mesorhizobium sp. B2-5-9]|uniref:glycosyltransferase family 2 protein n=1 Tax=Mesorhizobium sp. B2-5-9 TaxID=2589921 RepID=UPI0015E424BE|nr:glycosyltransferase family 2 protein [Mesorhizobium sp. B2-5-9]
MNKVRIVSVVVPTRDRPQFLDPALASIRALEGPDLTFEILVGDNGSNHDATAKVTQAHGAQHLIVTTAGAGAARNAAMRAATGEFLAFLDDDDVWTEQHVRSHLQIFDCQPEVEAVFGQVVMTDPNLRPIAAPIPYDVRLDGDHLKMMLDGYFPQIGATMARVGVRDVYGYFDETLLADQDWDWQLRLARGGHMEHVTVPCVLFRQRPSGSYDALVLSRIPYTRKVFMRHAMPVWRKWRSPKEWLHSYFATLLGFYTYFADAAVERAARGDAKGVRFAVRHALLVFPFRAVRQLVTPTPLRAAFFWSIGLGARPPAAQDAASD